MAHNLKAIEDSATRREKGRNKARTGPAAAGEDGTKGHDNDITHTFRRRRREDQPQTIQGNCYQCRKLGHMAKWCTNTSNNKIDSTKIADLEKTDDSQRKELP
ncbi:hypothetical protein AJ79_10312 [Helicocarpus griseus UAMH5409]|uniref:CCHC-type domain-containing protein n=1 Tax=Helicocarpus griseus UAMH5409 TaxID=1447875 RepID=A0A2B7WEK9_9EURO|nr:hypothetical protein AJ79_10312 [Helicocarpus griseus UAMH5409]